VIRHASTNLHNLSHGRVATLLDSAFVIDAGPIYLWLPGLVCLLGLAELLWRSGRLVVAFAVGHIGATLLVAVWLTTAVEMDWVAPTVSRATDVGMSYGAIAVLGALTAAIPRELRPMWVGWWLAVAAAVVAIGEDFTSVGHMSALVLGMLVSTRFGAPRRWTWARVILLIVVAAFGYLLLASSTWESLTVATASGVLGICVAVAVSGIRLRTPRSSRTAMTPADPRATRRA
jgi:hypothetical protein